MEKDLQTIHSIEALRTVVQENCPDIYNNLRPGLTKDAVYRIIDKLDLDDDVLVYLYNWQNGPLPVYEPDLSQRSFHVCGNFIALEKAVKTYRNMVRDHVWDEGLFPVLYNNADEYLLIDLKKNSPTQGMLFLYSKALLAMPAVSCYDSFPKFVSTLERCFAAGIFTYDKNSQELGIEFEKMTGVSIELNPLSEFWRMDSLLQNNEQPQVKLDLLNDVLEKFCKPLYKELQPGLPLEHLDTALVDSSMDYSIVKELYKWRNGYDTRYKPDGYQRSFHFFGNFLPLDEALATYKRLTAMHAGLNGCFPVIGNGKGEYMLLDIKRGSSTSGMMYCFLESQPDSLCTIYDSMEIFAKTLVQMYAHKIFSFDKQSGKLAVNADTDTWIYISRTLNPQSEYWQLF